VFGVISPFDTLVVSFDQEIQFPAEKDSAIEANHDFAYMEGKKASQIRLMGVDTSLVGGARVPHIAPDTDYEGLFKKIKNSDGDVQDEVEPISFSTMPILADSLNTAKPSADTVLVADSVHAAGILSLDDLQDFYMVPLALDDSLFVSLNSKGKLTLYLPDNTPIEAKSGKAGYKNNDIKYLDPEILPKDQVLYLTVRVWNVEASVPESYDILMQKIKGE
jgi:hypothetical protein